MRTKQSDKPPAPPPEFTTVDEIAARIGMSKQFVYRKLRDGVIPCLRLGTGPRPAVRITKAAADKYVESLAVEVKA